MASTKSAGVAEYKGRKYRCLFLGATKYGQRAHLQFFDGSKDFWVDASAVRVLESSAPARSGGSSRGRRTGCACGSIEGEYHDYYCDSCRFDELDQ